MKKGSVAILLFTILCVLSAAPARATFHIIVIEQVFAGFDEAPGAQFVMLHSEFDIQTFVHRQAISVFDASGTALPPFAAFCSKNDGTCDLPVVSAACAQGGCPTAIAGNDSRILIATPWARDLFCITPDLVATGTLPVPSGRVCWADTGHVFGPSCLAMGPVDCIAYGNFTGANGIFGTPAVPLMLGETLTGAAERTPQCALVIDRAASCVGGANANVACSTNTNCGGGTCVQCPGGSCRTLLNSSVGFAPGMPMPENFHGDVGALDGLAGDPKGSGKVAADDVDSEVDVLFEAGRRCALPAARRGADANLDTRIGAADLVATIQIVTTPSST